jgi:hypothetical protein
LARQLFDGVLRAVESCGPVTLVPHRDRVGFMVRVRFAGVVPRTRWVDLEFWLRRRIEHPRFRRVETLYPHIHLYRVRVASAEEIDAQLTEWLCEAYGVGTQEAPCDPGRVRPAPRGTRGDVRQPRRDGRRRSDVRSGIGGR